MANAIDTGWELGGSGVHARGEPRGRMVRRLGLTTMLACLLGACAGAPPAIVVPGAFDPLEPGVGFLVVQIDSDLGVERIQAGGIVMAQDLHAGRHIWLVRMKEGPYRWTDVRLVAAQSRDATIRPEAITVKNEREFVFEVEAGQLNYPGEIVIRMRDPDRGIAAGVTVRNRNHSAMALRKLMKTHSELVAAHPARYAGWSGDEFLQFYTREREARRESARAKRPAAAAK